MKKKAYESGSSFSLFINQGYRDTLVLGTIGDLMIVEYKMPSGTPGLNIMYNSYTNAYRQSVSYNSCPKKWIQVIRDGVGEWQGNCQRNGLISFPKEGAEC